MISTITRLSRPLLALICIALMSAAPWTFAATSEMNLLDDHAVWTFIPTKSGPLWDSNVLLVPKMTDGNAHDHAALRPISLSPAAAWRIQLRLAAVQPAAADAALGLVLVDPTGSFMAVMVRPQERDLIVIRSNGREWKNSPTGYVNVPMLDGSATAAHLLEVQSQGSRLRISIDGQIVLTTPMRDFVPTLVGLRATNTQARVDQWVLQENGQDSRLARLAGLVQVPGARICFEDKLEAANTAARAAKSLFSGVTSLFGSDPVAKEKASIDTSKAWVDNWSDADAAFTRDTVRKHLIVQTKGEDNTYQTAPESLHPLTFAGIAVQATIHFSMLQADNVGGVILQQTYPEKSVGQTPDEVLFAQVTPTEVRLYEKTNDAKQEWVLINTASHSGLTQRPIALRLVHQAENAWVFLDGRLVIAANNVKSLRVNSAGLRTEGITTMEVSHFLFSEI